MSLVFDGLDAYFENQEKKEKQELPNNINKHHERTNNHDTVNDDW